MTFFHFEPSSEVSMYESAALWIQWTFTDTNLLTEPRSTVIHWGESSALIQTLEKSIEGRTLKPRESLSAYGPVSLDFGK